MVNDRAWRGDTRRRPIFLVAQGRKLGGEVGDGLVYDIFETSLKAVTMARKRKKFKSTGAQLRLFIINSRETRNG